MTSTMKSEPARPTIGFTSVTTLASSAIWCAVGRTAEGILAAAVGGVAAFATLADAAAPATAAPARNLRRLTSGRESLRAILVPPYVPAIAVPHEDRAQSPLLSIDHDHCRRQKRRPGTRPG